MDSLYAQYLRERTHDMIIEMPEGFATYRFFHDEAYLKRTVYIVDLFVIPDFRKRGIASKMADQIVEKAKREHCSELIGTIVPSAKGATESMLTLIAYGMKIKSSSDNLIVLKKEI